MSRRVFVFVPVLTLWFSSRLAGADAPGPASPAGPVLSALEARASVENSYPSARPEFHAEVVQLVETNTLTTAGDFFRAAMLARTPLSEFRSVRMYYELLLAAAAKGDLRAENSLPEAWDSLLRALGRPFRFDGFDLAANNPDEFELSPAPACVREVVLHPAVARESAGKAANDAEVQRIVDADQAVRARWGRLSEAELKAVGAEDRQRNRRIREIAEAGGLHTAKDFANASLVMQHSANFAGYELAHELALGAMLLGDRGIGRWLVAATYDRMLRSLGHDQRFGTQGAIMFDRQTKPRLAETDEAGICDAERLALGCPTLAAKRADFYAKPPAP